jgi:phosphoglycerate dehydrogenase-like enzyme
MSADVAVLRQQIHGMSAAGYAAALRERLPDHEVALARTPTEERRFLAEAPVATGFALDPDEVPDSGLDLFACVFAGTGHLDTDALAERGVAVTSAAGVHGPNVAEHAVGAMLSFTRRFGQARRNQQERHWASFQARELAGSTVCVVGLGNIGEAVVRRLDGFGVDTIGVRYSPEKGGPTDEVVGYDEASFHDALARSEYVVVAAPLTETTEGLFDAEAFRSMRTDAVLVNVGRGPIVDTDALVDALRTNALGGAALDVTDPEPLPADHPLWGFDDVLITPHNAGHTPRYWDRLADIVAENVRTRDAGETDYVNRVA